MGPRGDAIVEADWSVGEVLRTLDRLNLTRNTLVIFTSDNGPVVDDGYKDGAVEKLGTHKPAGPFRGGKYSNFEGGTRVPLIVRWPGHVSPGSSEALVCQIDFLASLAKMTGTAVADARDSENLLDALLGKAKSGRAELIEEAGALALRLGNWKYIEPNNKQTINKDTNTELGNDAVPQLYDLNTDPGEARNVASSNPDRVTSMAASLDRIRNRRR